MLHKSSWLVRSVRSLLRETIDTRSQPEHLQSLSETVRAVFSTPNWSLQSAGYATLIENQKEPPQYSVLRKSAEEGIGIRRTPVYAVFQLGATQYKVSAGDLVYTERLKGVDVGSTISLERIQLAGTASETVVGRPYVDGAAVTAVVEVMSSSIMSSLHAACLGLRRQL